ncbi:MAG TPA: hypothetical protein ENI92_05975 [Bacteroidetes bacterium]|nr:hypothetical protein [Bacteroidota bacterium]
MNHKVPGDGGGLLDRLLRGEGNSPLPGGGEPDTNAGVERADLKWCTMACEEAEWPRENVDGAKSCRTFNALWCRVLARHVTRNAPCAVLHGARRPKANW